MQAVLRWFSFFWLGLIPKPVSQFGNEEQGYFTYLCNTQLSWVHILMPSKFLAVGKRPPSSSWMERIVRLPYWRIMPARHFIQFSWSRSVGSEG